MPSLDQILTFIKVVEASSYTAVANQQNLSKAAISKQISSLEDELKIQLIHRTTRRLTLTEAGEIYYQSCKKLAEVMEEMTDLTAQLKREPTGTLKIVSGRYIAEYYILPHLAEFMAAYPLLKVDLELAERIPDLYKEDIDIIIGMSIPGPPEAIQRSIGSTRYIFCASPAYLEKYGKPLNPTELPQHRYITHSMRKPNNMLTFKEELKVYLDPILRLNDAKSMVECALKGIGIIKVHDYMVQDLISQGKLIEVLQDYSLEKYPLYVYYMSHRYIVPKVRSFIDFILARL